MDSDTLTASMHRRGINMRFLGKLSGILETIESDSLNLLKNVIREEMILRAMKHIIRDLLVNLAKPFTGPCVAHILNCFFSKESDILVVHDDCHSYSCITPGSLKGMIRLQVRQRFRHDCSEIDHTFSQTHGYALLKGICKKIGIQIQARVYSFVKPDFTQNDILNFHPIVKTIEIHVNQTLFSTRFISSSCTIIQSPTLLLSSFHSKYTHINYHENCL